MFVGEAYNYVTMTKPQAVSGLKVPKPEWPQLIYQKRTQLKESQTVFGQRFGVSHAAVSDWERGVTDPPGEVTWWLMYGRRQYDAF